MEHVPKPSLCECESRNPQVEPCLLCASVSVATPSPVYTKCTEDWGWCKAAQVLSSQDSAEDHFVGLVCFGRRCCLMFVSLRPQQDSLGLTMALWRL